MKIDQVMLGRMSGDRAVGLYAVVVKLSEGWLAVPAVLLPSLFPVLVQSRETSPEIYRKRLEKMFNAMSLLAWAIVLPMVFGAGWIVRTLYGTAYLDAVPVLRIHMWGTFFVFLGSAQSLWEVAENFTLFSFAKSAAGAVVNVALNLVLIPRYGPAGAAVATVGSYSLAGFLLTGAVPRSRPLFFLQLRALFLPGVGWLTKVK
jgi:PST family polysaccharide transporter